MSGNSFNSSGGNLILGSGNIVNSGAGGVINTGSIAPGSSINAGAHVQAPQLALVGPALADFVASLGALKIALLSNGIDDAPALAARISTLEKTVLDHGGVVDAPEARALLSRVRYSAAKAPQVLTVLTSAADPMRERRAVDVFISYSRVDREKVAAIVRGLRALAIEVWTDQQISTGASFTDAICDELDVCRTQLVCWSPSAVSSDWVRGEAECGRTRGTIIPVMIEPCTLRPPFNMLHTADLTAWSGDSAHDDWRSVLRALAERISRPGLVQLAALVEARDLNGLAVWRNRYPDDPYASRTST